MNNANSTQIEIHKLSKPGCRPCQVIGYALAAEAEELAKLNAVVIEHDITEEPEILEKYSKKQPITGVPVLIFERNGMEMTRLNGMVNIREVFDAIEFAKEAR